MREQEVHRHERGREGERIESRGSRERIPDGGRRIEMREEIPPREVKHESERDRERERERERPRH